MNIQYKMEAAIESPIMFDVYERPCIFMGKFGDQYDTEHKALVRLMPDGSPRSIAVVKNSYKVVHNRDLFAVVDAEVEKFNLDMCGRGYVAPIIRDEISYYGKMCFREYTFPSIWRPTPGRKSEVHFRIVVVNGYGGSKIKLHAGAIIAACSNGIVLGDYVSAYAQHRKNVTLSKFRDAVVSAYKKFDQQSEKILEYADFPLVGERALEAVKSWLEFHFSEKLAHQLHRHFCVVDVPEHGSNLWALFNTLTYYASHNEGDFKLKRTKNDHEAATLLVRQEHVGEIIKDFDVLRNQVNKSYVGTPA